MPCIETAYRYNFCRLSVCRMTCICPNFIHRLTGNHVYARKHIMVSAFMSYSRSAIPLNIFLFLRISKNSLIWDSFFGSFPGFPLASEILRTQEFPCGGQIAWTATQGSPPRQQFLNAAFHPHLHACTLHCLLACFACLLAFCLHCCLCAVLACARLLAFTWHEKTHHKPLPESSFCWSWHAKPSQTTS